MKYADGSIVKIGDKIIHRFRFLTPEGKIAEIRHNNKVKVKYDTGITAIVNISDLKKDVTSVEVGKQPKGW
jgi:hypothetical protein